MPVSDDDHDSTDTASPHRPILVGYAFGPKKMSTMGVVMAEASRTKVATTASITMIPRNVLVPPHSGLNATMLEPYSSTPVSSKQEKSNNIAFSISSGPSTGLRNIVRYFRNNCSSCGDDEETTTTSITITSSTASSYQPSYPIRVSFVPLDLDAPLEEQHGGHFDVILHKMTEDCLVLSQMEDSYKRLVQDATPDELQEAIDTFPTTLQTSLLRIHRLIQYKRHHQHCALVDHPLNVQVVMSRLQIATLLQTSLDGVFSTTGIPCQTPRFVQYEPGMKHTLNYPLIAKPLTAAGTQKSHCMSIVLHEAGLAKMTMPCLLQEYANHTSVLFKVYVLGDSVYVFSRPSLPDLPTDPTKLQTLDPYIEFDSQRPYPTHADFGLAIPPCLLTRAALSKDDLTPIVHSLRNAFGLDLFGFDILQAGSVLLVVDVNYFPSYKEVATFPHLLAKFLAHVAIQHRSKQEI